MEQMKIYDSHGKPMGELDKPDPMQDGWGVWFEPFEYREGLAMEKILCDGHIVKLAARYGNPCWVMREIPTPTAADLAAIGMRCRDDSPVVVKHNDIVWEKSGSLCAYSGQQDILPLIGKHRWVLEDAPGEKVVISYCGACGMDTEHIEADREIVCKVCGREVSAPEPPAPPDAEVHTSCVGCIHDSIVNKYHSRSECLACYPSGEPEENYPRKNYTTAPQPTPSPQRIYSFEEVSRITAKARRPAPEAFTAEEIERIERWIDSRAYPGQDLSRYRIDFNRALLTVIDEINDPTDGLNAVTQRKGG